MSVDQEEDFDVIQTEEEASPILSAPDRRHQRIDRPPPKRFGGFTVVCLIINRIIGSGIFITPAYTYRGTGSVGTSLIFWAIGGIITICGLMVWLELGLSTPLLYVPGRTSLCHVPRSGGEKNFLEFVYGRGLGNRKGSKNLVPCLYGIPFILLANLSGNCIALAIFLLNATGRSKPEHHKGAVIGIAFAALTLVVSINLFSRRGGLLINNCFAVLKICLLIFLIVLGFKYGTAEAMSKNFSPAQAFLNRKSDFSSYSTSLLFVVYSYTGFEQPFYVLAEAKSPKTVYPRYTLLASCIGVVLYMLVNIAYFCVIPRDNQELQSNTNMALLFFSLVFSEKSEKARRAISGIIALSIFGNILVMTFTASRVKQEIAKEGIIPLWEVIATSRRTPWGIWNARRDRKVRARQARRDREAALDRAVQRNAEAVRDEEAGQHEAMQGYDHAPMAALCLHWVASGVLIGCTAMLKPQTAFQVLVALYSYSVITMNGFATALGLVLLYVVPSRKWAQRRSWTPVGSGLPYAVLYTLAFGVLLVTVFLRPREDSPFGEQETGVMWWVVPVVGLLILSLGGLWYVALRVAMCIRGKELQRMRTPVMKKIEHDWVLQAEIVENYWRARDNHGLLTGHPLRALE